MDHRSSRTEIWFTCPDLPDQQNTFFETTLTALQTFGMRRLVKALATYKYYRVTQKNGHHLNLNNSWNNQSILCIFQIYQVELMF